MPKPDAEEFARMLLHHISGIRAEVRHIYLRFAELCANQSGESVEEVQAKWKKDSEALAKKLYLEALDEIGIPLSKDEGEFPPEV